nr:putative ribonuclease H-like domain-containing protein [Tanacetum cinerariifolium]
MDSCWTCGHPFHSYENCLEEIASKKERVPETYDYRSQYDAYEYDTYHANYNIEMEDDTMYQAGSESRPPMLNKENYVPWSSRLLRYAKSRPNGKLIHNSILNGPYVRRMIPEPGDANRNVNVNETFHEQTDDELTEKELKQIKADDQAIQTILLGLPEDIYAAVDSCETAQEIWLRMMDYGYNFMQTKIHVDNKSAICVIKNHVYHSKTNHIEIRHHFIRDSYKKRLIEMIKIYTDNNVADLLIKAFDVSRFNFLVASI